MDEGDDKVGDGGRRLWSFDDDAIDDDPFVKLLQKDQYYEFSVKLVNFLGFVHTVMAPRDRY